MPVGSGIMAKITKTTSLSIRTGEKGSRKRGGDEDVFLMLLRPEAAVTTKPLKMVAKLETPATITFH